MFLSYFLPSAMDTIMICSCVIVCISFFYLRKLLIFAVTKKRKNKPMLPPSPPSLPIVGHLLYLMNPLHQSLARLSSQHGPLLLLRFGNRAVLVVSSAELAQECFTTNDIAFANRPRLPSQGLSTYNYTSLGTASYGPKWREMRRIATVEVLSAQRLSYFADVRAEEARLLARKLFQETAGGEFTRVELRSRFFGQAMNIVMRMMFGKRYYAEEDGDEEARQFKKVVEEFLSLAGASNVGDFLPGAIGWLARRRLVRIMLRLNSYRDGFLQALVEERRRTRAEEHSNIAGKKTMIDAILECQNETPEQYTDTFIKSLVVTLMTAGTDTTSNTIEWAMSLLLNNPDKLAIARKEIDEGVGHARVLEESDLANLLYLGCIIKETLRMYPAVPLLIPHESAKDCKVGGYDIPHGTMLLVNCYAIQRESSIWLEPNKFMPERFLDVEVEKKMMLSFGMGRRGCPGEGLAMREVSLVLGTLIQCFEWKKVGSQDVDMDEGSGITMPKAIPLEAMCLPRQIMINVLSHL